MIFGNILDWVLTIFLFGLLLFIHEAGHFIMARLTGVKVEEFGFGFPPRLKKLFTWQGTDITLNCDPLRRVCPPARGRRSLRGRRAGIRQQAGAFRRSDRRRAGQPPGGHSGVFDWI